MNLFHLFDFIEIYYLYMLISATLPKFKDIPNIIEHISTIHPECTFKIITSNEVQIGCIVLNDNELKQMKTQYSIIGNKYAGATSELQRVVRELKDRILDHENKEIVAALKHQIELSDKDKTIVEKQTQVNELTVAYQHAVQRAALEREVCELKLRLATSTSTSTSTH